MIGHVRRMEASALSEHPYVDFYKANGISPVGQDISDLKRHFQRRDSLYRFLGIPSAFIRGRSVAEFGPGSGHNALFTASLEPARFLLVDGNPKGLAETRALLDGAPGAAGRCKVVESYFESFDTEERFDLVLAEGFLPHQSDPVSLLRHLARFVRPGGILVITTVSPVSVLAETLRRLIRTTLVAPNAPAADQLAVLRPVLAPHLAALPGMSRSLDDWLLDNIVQPFGHAELLTIPQAVEGLAGDFDLYGASPHFLTDYRWYKDVHGSDRGFNDNAVACYHAIVAGLIDCRSLPLPRPEEEGRALESLCGTLWRHMRAVEDRGVATRDPETVPLVQEIARAVGAAGLMHAAAALHEAASFLLDREDYGRMSLFPALWGRGQQYVSFIRRDGQPEG